MAERPQREILIEIARLGDTVKISAIDAETGVEAVVLGPANAARADLESLAVRKLERMLGDSAAQPKPPRGGTLA